MTDPNTQTPTHSDQEIINYVKEINKDVLAKPLISDAMGFDSLIIEYSGEHDKIYLPKIKYLTGLFNGMRTTRRDGNCFYRAFSFRFAELLKDNTDWARWALQNAINTRDLLVNSGYELGAIEGRISH